MNISDVDLGVPFIWDALIFIGNSVTGGLEQMGAGRKKGDSKSIWEDVRKPWLCNGLP